MEKFSEEKTWGDFILRIPQKVSSYNAKTKSFEMVDNAINRNYHKEKNFTTVKTKVMTVDPFVISDAKLEELLKSGKSEVYVSELKKFQNKNVYLDFESSHIRNLEKVTNNEIQLGDTILVNGYLHAEKGRGQANKDTVYFKLATASEKKDEQGKSIENSNTHAEIRKLYSSSFFYMDSTFEEKKREIEKGLHQNITVAITKMDKSTGLKFENTQKENGTYRSNDNSSYFRMKDDVFYLNAKSLDHPIKKTEADKVYYNQVNIPIIACGLENTPLVNQLDNLAGTLAITGKAVIRSYVNKDGEAKEFLALDITGGDKEKTYTICKNAYQLANLRAQTIERLMENEVEKQKPQIPDDAKKTVETIDIDI